MPAGNVYLTLWRHRVMIVLLTAVAGLAAYAFTRTQPTIYEANALIRIQQRGTPAEAYGSLGSLELGQRLAQTYARIVQTRSMYERVAKSLEGQVSPEDISISATPVGEIELLTISARSENPAAAALVANATTGGLRRFIRETGTLRDQIVVIDSATAPTIPILPRTNFTIALAVLFALLFNCALALGRNFFADRLPEVDQWEERFGRPVLATVPTLHLKGPQEVLSPRPDLPAGSATVMTTEALAGPTRWSIGAPEVASRGE
ncbi:MAG: Wzz/FepE/Etk N-terminal domain-containing protein [Actinomycetota bacterium]|nr:Wzz/FepE/Etk N-terminal domain-containing protein [Actinomycetota bacterium]